MKEIECHFTPRRAPSRSSEVAYESPPDADQVRRRFNASARSRPRWWSKFGGAGGCLGAPGCVPAAKAERLLAVESPDVRGDAGQCARRADSGHYAAYNRSMKPLRSSSST